MVFQLSEHFRRVVCAMAVVAYVLPAVLGALTLVGHAADHLAGEAQEQRRIAASLGLTHDGDGIRNEVEGPRSDLPISPVRSSTVVHTHGGSTHAHDGPVSDLIRITGHVDGTLTTDEPAAGQLATHVPANESVVHLATATKVYPTPVATSAATFAHSKRPVPPPRA